LTLSIIEAFRRGREIVKNYVSGSLVNLETNKGLFAFWDFYQQDWAYQTTDMSRPYTQRLGHAPKVGAACFLGAQAVGMGMDLREIVHSSFYVHPDFIGVERKDYPNGMLCEREEEIPASVARAAYPCRDGVGVIADAPIPIIIAHLNDIHDPRSGSLDSADGDVWTERDILNWLASLGYNAAVVV
jgi:hypothetical protein